MRIAFERITGAKTKPLPTLFDTATLPANEASQVRLLVEAANFFRLPANITANASEPDQFNYRIAIEDDGKQHTVVVGDHSVPGTLRPLLEWLTIAVRKH